MACFCRGPTFPDSGSDFLSGPCPQDGCPNATCSGQLVFWPCAPCPLTCDEISGQAVCSANQPCSSPGKGGPGPRGWQVYLQRRSSLQGSLTLGFP